MPDEVEIAVQVHHLTTDRFLYEEIQARVNKIVDLISPLRDIYQNIIVPWRSRPATLTSTIHARWIISTLSLPLMRMV